jgi:2-keto-4-pentenoate hydratase/2-oxohepta-3-ene-1,7-dioic acid hydratase in catechol pathway
MRLARVAFRGEAFWALVNADSSRLQRIRAPFAHWAAACALGQVDALELDDAALAVSDCQWLPPLEPGARVFGVGLNYLSHLQRLGSAAPEHTLAYIKPEDYEIELVAVVARPLGDEPKASACLLGYTCGNDISARDAGRQIGRLDLLTQKAMDRTTPVGPWIVTLDQIGVGQPQLDLCLSVNGERRQQDNTRQMIFPVDELLNFLDARIELRPGDLIFTGSTHGVGLETGRFLQPGDLIEASIDGIGALSNRVGTPRQLSPARAEGRLGGPCQHG